MRSCGGIDYRGSHSPKPCISADLLLKKRKTSNVHFCFVITLLSLSVNVSVFGALLPPLSTKALPNILAEVLLSQVKFNSRNYRQKELVKSYSSTDGS